MGGNEAAEAVATGGADELVFVDDCTLSALLLVAVAVVEIILLRLVGLLPNEVGAFFAVGGNAGVPADDWNENDDDGDDDENGVFVVVLLPFAESVFGNANDAAENEKIPAPVVLPLLGVVFDAVSVEETPKLVGGTNDGAAAGDVVS